MLKYFPFFQTPSSRNLEIILHKLTAIFRPLEKVTLLRTHHRIKDDTSSAITTTTFHAFENETKIFSIFVKEGASLSDFGIKVFSSQSQSAPSLLCSMHLETNLDIKGLVLRILLPNDGGLIGSVTEMGKGLSKTAFILGKENETLYQVLTTEGLGGFGWTTSAKILTPEGNEKVGGVSLNLEKKTLKRRINDFKITLNLPKTHQDLNKVLVLGASLVLVKDF